MIFVGFITDENNIFYSITSFLVKKEKEKNNQTEFTKKMIVVSFTYKKQFKIIIN